MELAPLLEPCATCPYRKSVRLAFWDISEYQNLLAHDAEPFGREFGCHGEAKRPPTERRACVGWLLDQRRRGVPNLLLRMRLMSTPGYGDYFNGLKDLGRKLYSGIQKMMDANYPGGKSRPMQPRKASR